MATPTITTSGRDYLSQATAVLSKAFETDPVITYLTTNMSPEARLAYLPKYFDGLLTAAALNKGTFTEASSFSCIGVLIPPGSRIDNPFTLLQSGMIGMLWNLGFGGYQRMLNEYTPLSDACKKKALKKKEKYYYVFFIGTKEEERGKGLCGKIMKQWQEEAGKEGTAIVLEATTQNSRRLYERLGWKVVDEIVLGKGKVGSDGLQKGGGEGVKIWGMIWRPDQTA